MRRRYLCSPRPVLPARTRDRHTSAAADADGTAEADTDGTAVTDADGITEADTDGTPVTDADGTAAADAVAALRVTRFRPRWSTSSRRP